MPRNGSKSKATAQNQELLFAPIDIDILEEITIGDNRMRLVKGHNSKNPYIQLWSSLSQTWRATYRYRVLENWEKWKRYADIHNARQRDGGNEGNDPDPKSKRRVSKRKPRMDTSPVLTKTSNPSRKHPSKNKH